MLGSPTIRRASWKRDQDRLGSPPSGAVTYHYDRLARVALLVAGLWSLAMFGTQLLSMVRSGDAGGDLIGFVAAAERGLAHGWIHAYDAPVAVPRFVELPVVAWSAASFAILPAAARFPIWVALLLIAAYAAWRILKPARGMADGLWLLGLIASFPFVYSIALGQLSPAILLLLALFVSWLGRQKPIAAGLALAIALQLKPTVAFMCVPCLLAAGQWRALGACLAVSSLFAISYLVVLGPQFPLFYAHTVAIYSQGTVGAAIPFLINPLVGYALRLPLAAAVLAVAYRWDDRQGVAAAGITGSFVVTPYAEPYDLLALFVTGWILQRLAGGWVAGAIFALGMLLAVVTPASPYLIPAWEIAILGTLALVRFGRPRALFARLSAAGSERQAQGVLSGALVPTARAGTAPAAPHR
jgi:hypothetical protein